jgi:hypothetical protein
MLKELLIIPPAWLGWAWHGRLGCGMDRLGPVRRGKDGFGSLGKLRKLPIISTAWHVEAGSGKDWNGMAGHGAAWSGKDRTGMDWQGKVAWASSTKLPTTHR